MLKKKPGHWKQRDDTVYHLLVIGDTDAVGQQGGNLPLGTITLANKGSKALMMGVDVRGGVIPDPNNVNSISYAGPFQPLREPLPSVGGHGSYGETLASGWADQLERLTGKTFLVTVDGWKDIAMDTYDRPSQTYSNILLKIKTAKMQAAGRGCKYAAIACVFEGAADQGQGATTTGSLTTQLQNDLSRDVNSLTGQVGTLLFLTTQLANLPLLFPIASYGGAPQNTPNLQTKAIHDASPRTQCCLGKKHQYGSTINFARSPHHMHWFGYNAGRAVDQMCFRKQGPYYPLKPLSATLSGSTVHVEFNGTAPLVLDFQTMVQGFTPINQSDAVLGTVTRAGNAVTAVGVTSGGGYMPGGVVPVFTGGGGSGAAGTVVLKASVAGAVVDAGGTGYTASFALIFSGGSPTTPAAATVNVANGAVTSITMTNVGAGYTSTPTISFANGAGSGASAHLILNSIVSSITITNGGSGYTSNPTVTLAYPVQYGGFWFVDDSIGNVYITGATVVTGLDGLLSAVDFTLSGTPTGSAASRALRAGMGHAVDTEGARTNLCAPGRINLRDSDPYMYLDGYPGWKYCCDFQIGVN